jgi:hypothetical protein
VYQVEPGAQLRRVFGRRIAAAEQGKDCIPGLNIFLQLHQAPFESRPSGRCHRIYLIR